MTSTQVDIKAALKNAVMLSFSKPAWGNRKKADKGEIETSADKAFLGLSKKLVDSPEYQAILNFQTMTKRYLEARSVNCPFAKGHMIFNVSQVMMVEDYLEKANRELSYLVTDFLAKYAEAIDAAEKNLAGQFNREDYPSPGKLARAFRFDTRWVEFNIPENLPGKIFEEEKVKAENAWREATEKISLALRESFAKMISVMAKNLEPDPDGKKKRFKDASFENITEFIATFKNRNLFDDRDLASLVSKAEDIMKSIDNPQALKKDEKLMASISEEFKAIECNLKDMIEKSPARKFDFDE